MIAYYKYVFIYLVLYCVPSITGDEMNDLSVKIEYGENDTFILSYNLSTNYSYYLTFRLFEHEQIKFRLCLPTYQYKQYSIQIPNHYDLKTDLFIICFHFIRQFNDIDIQCIDIRSSKPDQFASLDENQPSYKPLFVPMMYALSVLMLLPVFIQHRRHKRAQLIKRRKELRRLSITITQDNPNIVSHIVANGNINLKKIPIQIELVSLPLKRTNLEDNDNVTFTFEKLQPFFDNYDDDEDESGITADDCIAHLLNNTPWTSSLIEQSPTISLVKRNSVPASEEEYAPMKTTFNNNVDDDDRQPILKSNAYCTVNLFRTNPAFIESDV
jgi:hypothetical protein